METEPRPPGRPRNPEVERRILESTLAIMERDGFSRMTIDAIAEAAGVSKPTIYRRWTGKADIATSALVLLRFTEPPLTGHTAVDRLKQSLVNFRKSLLRPNGMALLGTVLAEEAHTPELLEFFRIRVVKPRRLIVARLLEEAQHAGELPPKLDVEALVSMLIGSIYARYLSGEPIPPKWIDRIVNAAVKPYSLL